MYNQKKYIFFPENFATSRFFFFIYIWPENVREGSWLILRVSDYSRLSCRCGWQGQMPTGPGSDVADIEVTGSEVAPGQSDRAWWRVWQLEHRPRPQGQLREVLLCEGVGFLHPGLQAETEIWILCDIPNCKILTLNSVFQTERRLNRGHLAATSGARAALSPPLCSGVGGLHWVTCGYARLVPRINYGFCACLVSPSSRQELRRLKKMNQGIELDSRDLRPSAPPARSGPGSRGSAAASQALRGRLAPIRSCERPLVDRAGHCLKPRAG